MENQNVPPLTLVPRVIDEETEKWLKKWIEYIKNVSPRILISSILDEDFKERRRLLMESIHLYLCDGDPNDTSTITNLNENDILFFLAINLALGAEPQKYAFKDICIFCSKDRAFFTKYEGFDFENEKFFLGHRPEDEDEHWSSSYCHDVIFNKWEVILPMFINRFAEEWKEKVPPFPGTQ